MISSKSKVKIEKRPVAKGFRSPSDDFLEMPLDLNTRFIKHPASTFFMKAKGNEMKHVGIFDGDLLIIDRARNPKDRSVIVAVIEGEFVVSRLNADNGEIYLEKDNLPVNDVYVWGIVAHVVRSF